MSYFVIYGTYFLTILGSPLLTTHFLLLLEPTSKEKLANRSLRELIDVVDVLPNLHVAEERVEAASRRANESRMAVDVLWR